MELYIHVPFCVRKCHYCDFLSFPSDASERERYTQALCRELRWYGGLLSKEPVETVYFGGGTPSWLETELFMQITEALADSFEITPDAEITLEANPGTLTKESLAVYRAAGVNRLSLGLQSVHDEELAMLGRIHTWRDFLKSFELARQAGFSNINVDLMTGLPGQTKALLADSLRQVARLRPEHISAYGLQVEEGTYLAKSLAEETGTFPALSDEEEAYALYRLAVEMLAANGYSRYEISNYARNRRICRHNDGYWTRKPYLGVGLGAASLLREPASGPSGARRSAAASFRQSNVRKLQTYCKASLLLDQTTDPFRSPMAETQSRLTAGECMEEFMFLGLRRTDGVRFLDFLSCFGKDMREVYGPVLLSLSDQSLLQISDEGVRLTERGLEVSTPVLAEFLLS